MGWVKLATWLAPSWASAGTALYFFPLKLGLSFCETVLFHLLVLGTVSCTILFETVLFHFFVLGPIGSVHRSWIFFETVLFHILVLGTVSCTILFETVLFHFFVLGLIGSVHRSVDGSFFPLKIIFPLYHTLHFFCKDNFASSVA